MDKEEFITRYGKKAYLRMIEENKLRNRAARGYKGDNRGSWEREVLKK